ncbi:hypothetical protein [Paenibacillus sp. PAMC 26794]|uniref:hypothetical protein n=1 Tax=Paenibacillus sp. PAMC 26794 TaxID=1257080 RepID=UPI0002DAC78C|nr:hypothetical protein [Paenibacillus sp. PAMC 26794]
MVFVEPVYNLGGITPTSNAMIDKLQTAEVSSRFNFVPNYGISALRDVITTTGGGTVSNSGENFLLQSSATANSLAQLTTTERGQFLSVAFDCGMNVQVPAVPVGTQKVEWGYTDGVNGVYFGQDSVGVYVALLQNGVETQKVYQQNWNVDTMDGTSQSRVTLNTFTGYLYQIRYGYSYGQVELRIVAVNPQNFQQPITIHRFNPLGDILISDPNQNIKALANNGAAGGSISLNVGGRYFNNLGTVTETSRITTEMRTNTLVTNTVFSPTVSFRRKQFFPDATTRPNSVNLSIESFDILASVDFAWELRINAQLTGASFGTIASTPSSETALLSDVTATAMNQTAGVRILAGISLAGKTEGLSNFNVNYALPGNEILTLAVKSLSGIGNGSVALRMRELW